MPNNLQDLLEADGFQLKKHARNELCGPCPWCGGEDRFIYKIEEDRYWCRQCRRSGDAIQYLIDFKRLTFPEAKRLVGDNGQRPSGPPTQAPRKKAVASPSSRGPMVAAYDYHDRDGNLLFGVCRFEPGEGDREKDFLQRQPNGRGGWTWGIKEIPLVLYHLPEVIRSDYVFIMEGEKDVDWARSLGIVATTTPGGAGNKINGQQEKHGLLDCLKGKKVYLIPDNDDAGVEHMEQIATLLYGNVKELKLVPLPGLPEKGDFSNWADMIGDKKAPDLLRERVKELPAWTPPKSFVTARELMNANFSKQLFVISPVLPVEGGLIIVAESGVGKSLIALEGAIRLSMGWDILDLEVSTARKVLIIQVENPMSQVQFRLTRMLKGLGIEEGDFPDRLFFSDPTARYDLEKSESVKAIIGMLENTGADVFILDPLSSYHKVEENNNVAMRQVLDQVTYISRETGASSIIVHHFGKPSADRDDAYRYRGASSIKDWADSMLSMTARPHRTKILRDVNFLKVRHGSEPKAFLVERDEHFLHTIVEVDTICPPRKVRDILSGLGGKVDSQGELIEAIQEEFKCHKNSASACVRAAVRAELIGELSRGQGKQKSYYVAEE